MNSQQITKEIPWTQTALSSNGTLGSGSFSVAESSYSNDQGSDRHIYQAFDGDSDTNKTYWRPSSVRSWFTFYSSVAIRLIRLDILNLITPNTLNVFGTPTAGYVEGSNDNATWISLISFNNVTTGAFTLNVNSSDFYKYHRVTITATNDNDVPHIRYINITANKTTTITIYPEQVQSDRAMIPNDMNTVVESMRAINVATGSKMDTSLLKSVPSTTGQTVLNQHLTDIQTGLNKLESLFSNNCCQSITTDCCQGCQFCQTCQVTACQTQSCQFCQACQACESLSCQSCQTPWQCSNCNCTSNCNCCGNDASS
jgi:hypothetical protein